MSDSLPPGSADARPTTTPPPPPPRSSTARTVPMRPASSVARTIQHAPAHVTIPAAVLDCVVAGGLLVLLWGHRLDSVAERILALVGLLAVAGVRVADVLRALRGGGPPTGAGPALVLLACAQAAGHYLATAWRVAALGVLALGVMSVGCAGGPRSADDTIATTLKVVHVARGVVCNDGVDAVLGRPGPLTLEAPSSAIEGVRQVRSYVCADELTSLLETTTALMTPRPAPSSPTATSTPTTSSSAEDAGPPPPTIAPTADGDAGDISADASDDASPGDR